MSKKLISIALISCAILTAQAQIETPKASPAASLEQTVGVSKINVDYSRPSAKDREIFGDLVPYGELWRTGANKNTVVYFSSDVHVAGESLKKGDYALFTIPDKNEWEIIFYDDSSNEHGIPQDWDDDKVMANFKVETKGTPSYVEDFTVDFTDMTMDKANMNIRWADTEVTFEIVTPTEELVLHSIKEAMLEDPSAEDYATSASYYLNTDKDLNKALDWIDQAIKIDGDKFYWLRDKSLIQVKLGDTTGAIKTAKKSMKLAKKAGNDQFVKMNMESIDKWK